MLELCSGRAELLVLARYMQILSSDFPERVGMPAINIHHSFLPAFTGNDTSAARAISRDPAAPRRAEIKTTP
jgi:formyltetrahydrofolate hydrolase